MEQGRIFSNILLKILEKLLTVFNGDFYFRKNYIKKWRKLLKCACDETKDGLTYLLTTLYYVNTIYDVSRFEDNREIVQKLCLVKPRNHIPVKIGQMEREYQ